MKKKINFIDNINNKTEKIEIEIPNKAHLDAQINYPSKIIKPKKGKGSYTRKQKYNNLVIDNQI